MTFTSEFPHATGLETIGGGSNNMQWWNQTGAVWVLSVESMGVIIKDLGLLDTSALWPAVYSSAVVEGPDSSAFTITVPAANCIGAYVSILSLGGISHSRLSTMRMSNCLNEVFVMSHANVAFHHSH